MKNKNKVNFELMSADMARWCREQADLYFAGKLEQAKIDKLNEIGFPWKSYQSKEVAEEPAQRLFITAKFKSGCAFTYEETEKAKSAGITTYDELETYAIDEISSIMSVEEDDEFIWLKNEFVRKDEIFSMGYEILDVNEPHKDCDCC